MTQEAQDYAFSPQSPKEYTAFEAADLVGETRDKTGKEYDFEPDPVKSLDRSKQMGLVDPKTTPEQYAPKHTEMAKKFDEQRQKDYDKLQNAAIFYGDPSKRIDYSGGNDKTFIQSKDFKFNARPTSQQTKEQSFFGDRSKDIHTEDELLDAKGAYKTADGDYKSLALYDGEAAKEDGKGHTFVLSKEFDPTTGEEVWTEKNASDVLKGSLLRSSAGPQKMQEGYLATFAHSFWNGAANMFDSNLGSAIEMVGNLGGWKSFKDTGNYFQNTAAASRYKNAKELESGGIFEGNNKMKHLTAGMGELLGQLAPVIAVGYLTGGLGAEIMGAEALVANYNSMRMIGLLSDVFGSKGLANGVSLGRVLGGRAVQGLPTFGASLYAADRMNQEMKELGMSESHRLKMYGAVALMNALTEDAIGSNMVTRGLGRTMNQGIESEARKGFDELFKPFARSLAGVAAEGLEGKAATSKVMALAKKFAVGYNSFLQKAAEGGVMGKIGQGLSSGLEEGTEEVAQTFLENSFKLFSNYTTEGTLDDKGKAYGKFNVDGIFDGMAESFVLGALGGFAPGLAFHSSASAKKGGAVASETEMMHGYVQKHGWNDFYQKYSDDQDKFLASFQPQEDFTSSAKEHKDFVAAAKQQSELVRDTLIATMKPEFAKNVLGNDQDLLQSYVKSSVRSKQIEEEIKTAQTDAEKTAKQAEKDQHDAYIKYIESGQVLNNRKAAAGLNIVSSQFGMNMMEEGIDYGFSAESKGEFGALKMMKDTETDITSEKARIKSIAEDIVNRDANTTKAFNDINDSATIADMQSIVESTISKGVSFNPDMVKTVQAKLKGLRKSAMDELIKGLNITEDDYDSIESSQSDSELEGMPFEDAIPAVRGFVGEWKGYSSKIDSLGNDLSTQESKDIEQNITDWRASKAIQDVNMAKEHQKLLQAQLIADPKTAEDNEKNDGINLEIAEITGNIKEIEDSFEKDDSEEATKQAIELTAHMMAVRKSLGLLSDQELDSDGTGAKLKNEKKRITPLLKGFALRSFAHAFGEKGKKALETLGIKGGQDAIQTSMTMSMLNAYSDSIDVKIEKLAKEESESEALNDQMRIHQPQIEHFIAKKLGDLFGVKIEDFDDNDPIGSWKKAVRTIQESVSKDRSKLDALATILMKRSAYMLDKGVKAQKSEIAEFEALLKGVDSKTKEFLGWLLPFIDSSKYPYHSVGLEGSSDSSYHLFPASTEDRVEAEKAGKVENDLLAFDIENFMKPTKSSAQVAPFVFNFLLQLNGETHSESFDKDVDSIIANNNNIMPGWGDITYEQQLALKSAVAFMNGSQSEGDQLTVHNKIMSAWGINSTTKGIFLSSPQFMSVLGSAGSGKSTRVTGTAIEIDLRNKLREAGYTFDYKGGKVNEGQKAIPVKYIISGFSETVRDNFVKYFNDAAARVNGYSGNMLQFGLENKDLNSVMKGLIDGSLSDKNSVVQIFIDESSQINADKLMEAMRANSTTLSEAKSGNFANSQFSVMMFGDPLQSTKDKSNKQATSMPFQSWKMIQVHRTGLPVFWHFQRFMRSQIAFKKTNSTMTFNDKNGFGQATYYSDVEPTGTGVDMDFAPAMASKNLKGTLFVPESLSDKVVDAFIARVKSLSPNPKVTDVALILYNKESLKQLKSKEKYAKILETYKDNILFIDDAKLAAQGMTIKDVFVVNDGTYKDGYGDKMWIKDMLTVGTRPTSFLMMAGPTSSITERASNPLEEFKKNDDKTAERVRRSREWLGLDKNAKPTEAAEETETEDEEDMPDDEVDDTPKPDDAPKDKPKEEEKPKKAKKQKAPEPKPNEDGVTIEQPTRADIVTDEDKGKAAQEIKKKGAVKRNQKASIPTMDAQTRDSGHVEMIYHYQFTNEANISPVIIEETARLKEELLYKLKGMKGDITVRAYKPDTKLITGKGIVDYNGLAFAFTDPHVLAEIGKLVDSLGNKISKEGKTQIAYALVHAVSFNAKSANSKSPVQQFFFGLKQSLKNGESVAFKVKAANIYPQRLTFEYGNSVHKVQQLGLQEVLDKVASSNGTPSLMMLPQMMSLQNAETGRVPMLYIGQPTNDVKGLHPTNDYGRVKDELAGSLAQIQVATFSEHTDTAIVYLNDLIDSQLAEAEYNLEELLLFNHSIIGEKGLKAITDVASIVKGGRQIIDLAYQVDVDGNLNLVGDKKRYDAKRVFEALRAAMDKDTKLTELVSQLRFPLSKASKDSTRITGWHHKMVSKNPIEKGRANPLKNDTHLIRMFNNRLSDVNATRLPIALSEKTMKDSKVESVPMDLTVPINESVAIQSQPLVGKQTAPPPRPTAPPVAQQQAKQSLTDFFKDNGYDITINGRKIEVVGRKGSAMLTFDADKSEADNIWTRRENRRSGIMTDVLQILHRYLEKEGKGLSINTKILKADGQKFIAKITERHLGEINGDAFEFYKANPAKSEEKPQANKTEAPPKVTVDSTPTEPTTSKKTFDPSKVKTQSLKDDTGTGTKRNIPKDKISDDIDFSYATNLKEDVHSIDDEIDNPILQAAIGGLLSEQIGKDRIGVNQVSPETLKRFWGYASKAGIGLSTQDGVIRKGTAWHEFTHFVERNLLSESQRNAVREEVLKMYPSAAKLDKDGQDFVSEQLAEMTRDYALQRQHKKGLSKILQDIIDWIVRLFDSLPLIGNEIRKLEYDIYHGRFADRANTYLSLLPKDTDMSPFAYSLTAQQVRDNFAGHNQSAAAITKFLMSQVFDSPAFSNIVKDSHKLSSDNNNQLLNAVDNLLGKNARVILAVLRRNGMIENADDEGAYFAYTEKGIALLQQADIDTTDLEDGFYEAESYFHYPRQMFVDDSNKFKVLLGHSELAHPFTLGESTQKLSINELIEEDNANLFEQMLFDTKATNVGLSQDFLTYFAYLSLDKDMFNSMIGNLFPRSVGIKEYLDGKVDAPIGRQGESSQSQSKTGQTNPLDMSINDFFRNMLRTIKTDSDEIIPEELHRTALMANAMNMKMMASTPSSKDFAANMESFLDDVESNKIAENAVSKVRRAHYRTFFDTNVLSYASWARLARMSPEDSLREYQRLYANGVSSDDNVFWRDKGHNGSIGGYVNGKNLTFEKLVRMYSIAKRTDTFSDEQVWTYWQDYVRSKGQQGNDAIALFTNLSMSAYNQNVTKQVVKKGFGDDNMTTSLQHISAQTANTKTASMKDSIMSRFTTGLGMFNMGIIDDRFGKDSKRFGIKIEGSKVTFTYKNSTNESMNVKLIEFDMNDLNDVTLANNFKGNDPWRVINQVFEGFGIPISKDLASSMLENVLFDKENQSIGLGFLREHLPTLIATAVTLRSIDPKVKEKDRDGNLLLTPYGENTGLFIQKGTVYRPTPAGYMIWGYDDKGKLTDGHAKKAWTYLDKMKGFKPSNLSDIFNKNIAQEGDVAFDASQDVSDAGSMYFFSEFNDLIGKIAESMALGQTGSPKTYVDGAMRLLTAKSTPIEQVHPQDETGKHTSKKQFGVYESVNKTMHPHFSSNGDSIIPLLTESGLKQMEVLLSHKEGFREVSNDKATFADIALTAFTALKENIIKNGLSTSLVDNMGERSTHLISFDLREYDQRSKTVKPLESGKMTNGVLSYTIDKKTGDIKDLEVEYKNILSHIRQLSNVLYRSMELSKGRMESAISQMETKYGFTRDTDEKNGRWSDYEYMKRFFVKENTSRARNGLKPLSAAEMNNKLAGLGLIENQDYIIQGGEIQLGHDYTGNTKLQTIYNSKALFELEGNLKKAKKGDEYNPDGLRYAIDEFFKPLYKNFATRSYENNVKVPKEFGGKITDKTKSYSERYPPAVKGVVIQHFLNNAYFFEGTYGSVGTFQSIIDANKRLNDFAAPREVPIMRDPAYNSFTAITLEDVVENAHAIGTVRGSASDKIKMTDGLIRSNPLLEYIFYHNTGGQIGQIDWRAQQKRKGNFKDNQRQKYDDKKGMDMPLTATEFLYSASAQKELEMMLNPYNWGHSSLWHDFKGKYDAYSQQMNPVNAYYQSIQEIGDEIMEQIEHGSEQTSNDAKYILSNMIGMLEYKSTLKSSNRENTITHGEMDRLHGTGELFGVMNNRNWSDNGLQTLLNKNTEETEMMKFSQMFNHLTLAPWGWKNGKTMGIIEKMAQLSIEAPEKFLEEYGGNAADAVKNKMLAVVKSIASEAHLADLLANPHAGIDYPQVEAKAFQAIRSELVKKGIKFEMPAHRLTEVSAYHIDIYSVGGINLSLHEVESLFNGKKSIEINGKSYSYEQILASKRKLQPNRILISVKKSNPIYGDIEQIVLEELKRAKFTALIDPSVIDAIINNSDNLGEYEEAGISARQRIFDTFKTSNKSIFSHAPSESIVPPIKDLSKFGFERNSQFNDIFTLYKEDEDGNVSMVDISKADAEKIESYVNQGYNTRVKNRTGKPINMIGHAKLGDIIKKIIALQQYNEMFVQRTPSSNASSGSMHKVVGWHHDGGSVIFSSAKRSLLTGHDHDGDEINAYYREADGDEIDALKDVQTSLFDYTKAFYEDIENAEYFMTPIDMGSWKDLKKSFEDALSLNDRNPDLQFFDLASALYNRVNSVAGKTVGQFANSQKSFDFMASAQQFWEYWDRQSIKPSTTMTNNFIADFARPNQFDFDPKIFGQLLADLGDMVNLATDNVKEQILGALFVNGDNAFMVASMKMQEKYLRKYMMDKHPNGRVEYGSKGKETLIKYDEAGFPRLFLDFMTLPFVKSVLKRQANSMSAVEGNSVRMMESWHLEMRDIAKYGKEKKYKEGFEYVKSVKQEDKDPKKSYLFTDGGYMKEGKQVKWKDMTDADYDGFVAEFNKAIKAKKFIVFAESGFNTAKNMLKKDAPKIHAFLKSEVEKFVTDNTEQNTVANKELLDSTYADAQAMANFIMAGDYVAAASDVFKLDQGTQNEDWSNENSLRNIEFLAGMPIKELIDLHERFLATKDAGVLMEHFDKPGKAKRVQFSKDMKRIFNINNDWTTLPIAESNNRGVADIWWGTSATRANGILSNIAPRDFKWRSPDGKLRTYFSVEHAYQSWKSGAFNEETFKKYKKGEGEKHQGVKESKDEKGKKIVTEDGYKDKLMAELIEASFEGTSAAAKKAKQALIDTGNTRLTHVNDKGYWGQKFPELLQAYRNKISPQTNSEFTKTYADSFHYQFDMLAALMARPDLMAWIQQANSMRELMSKAFIKHDPIFKNFVFDFFQEIGYDMPSKQAYGKAMNKLQDYLVHRFFNEDDTYKNTFPDGLPIFALSVKEGVGKTAREIEFNNKLSDENIHASMFGGDVLVNGLKGYKTDLSEPDGRYRFVLGFPRFIEQIRDSLIAYESNGKKIYADNFFLQSLVSEGDAKSSGMLYATLRQGKNMDRDTETKLRTDFARLPKKFREMMGYYAVVKDSFSYSEGSLSQVVDTTVHEKFGAFTHNFRNQLSDEATKQGILNTLRDHIKPNLIGDTSQNWLLPAGKDGKNLTELGMKMGDEIVAKTKISLGTRVDAWVAMTMKDGKMFGSRTAFPSLANSISTNQGVIKINGEALFNNEERKKKQGVEIDPELVSEFFYFDYSDSLQKYMIGVVDRLSYPEKYRGTNMPEWAVEVGPSSKEAPFAKGDVVKLPFGLTVVVTESKGKYFRFKALERRSDHAIFTNRTPHMAGGPLISQNGVDKQAPTAMSTEMKSDHIDRMQTVKSVKRMIDHFRTMFPNVDVIEIDDEHPLVSTYGKALSFVHTDGKVYLNMDRIEQDVAMEEFQHVWNIVLKETNPQLWNTLLSKAKADASFMDWGKGLYGNRWNDDEIVANAVRLEFSRQPKQGFLSQIWDSIKAFFKNLFGYRDSGELDKLTSDSTLSQIINAMLKDYQAGRVYSNITSEEVASRLPSVMTAMATGGIKFNGFDKSTVENRLLYPPEGYDPKREAENRLADAFTLELMNQYKKDVDNKFQSVHYTSKQTGATYKIEKSSFGGDMRKLRELVVKNIVPNELADDKKVPDLFASFLREVGRDSEVSLLQAAANTIKKIYSNEYFAKKIESGSNLKLTQEAIESKFAMMLNHIGFNADTDSAFMSTDMGLAKHVLIPDDVKSDKTLVIVHNAGQPNQSVSLLQFSDKRINEDFDAKNKTLADRVISDEKKSIQRGVTWKMNNANVQNYLSGLQIIAMKKNNPNLKVRAVYPFSFHGNEDAPSLFNISNKTNLPDILDQTKAMLNFTLERDAMPESVRLALKDDSVFDHKKYGYDPILALADMARKVASDTDDQHESDTLNAIADSSEKLRKSFQSNEMKEFQRLLLKRKRYIEMANNISVSSSNLAQKDRMLERKKALMASNDEYRAIVNAFIASENRGIAVVEAIENLNTFEAAMMSGDRFKDPIGQLYFNRLHTADSHIRDSYKGYLDSSNDYVSKLKKSFGYDEFTATDVSETIYGGIMEKSKLADGSSFNTGNIIVGKTIDETFHLLLAQNSDKSTEQVMKMAQAAFFFEKAIFNSLVDSIAFSRGNKFTKVVDGKESIDRSKIEEYINHYRAPGTMPVIGGGLNEKIKAILKDAKGDSISAKKLQEFSAAIFEEMYSDATGEFRLTDSFAKNDNMFLAQFNLGDPDMQMLVSPTERRYGSKLRMKLLGIEQGINGELRWKGNSAEQKTDNQRVNGILSKNMQYIANTAMIESISNIEYGSRLNPIAEMLVLKSYQMAEMSEDIGKEEAERKVGNIITSMNDAIVNRSIEMIKGNVKIFGKEFDPNQLTMAAMIMKGMAVFGMNAEAALKNGLQATMASTLRGLSSHFSRSEYASVANIKDGFSMAAQAYIMRDEKMLAKFEALNWYLGVNGFDRRELISSPILVAGERVLSGKDAAALGFKFMEKVPRLGLMAAMLMKEGLWNALEVHDGKLHFDILKWENPQYVQNGKLTADGQVMNSALMAEILREGGDWAAAQSRSNTAVLPFPKRTSLRIKSQIDMTLGSMSEDTRAELQRSMLGKAVMQFWSFAPQYFWNFFGTKNKNAAMAKWEVEKGEVIEKLPIVEGVMESLHTAWQVLREDGMKEGWEQLEPIQKDNVVRMALTVLGSVMVFGVIAALIKAIAGAKDDKELKEKNPMVYWAYNRVFAKAFSETTSELYFAKEIGNKFRGSVPPVDYIMSVPEAMLPLCDPRCWSDPKYMENLWNGEVDRATGKRRSGLKSVLPYGLSIDQAISFSKLMWIYGFGREE